MSLTFKRVKYTIHTFRKEFPNENACLDRIFALRFDKMPCCPQCAQETTFKRIPGRRSYQCSDKDCQYQLYPTAGTIFEKTRTNLVNWFYAIYLMTSTRNGVSAKELERQLGITYKTAWRMGHQIRDLMSGNQGMVNLSGVVEVDEAYVGGLTSNMHKKKREHAKPKTAILGMVERGGRVITKVVPNTTTNELMGHIRENIAEGTLVITDNHTSYFTMPSYFKHESVNHSTEEYKRGEFHTNTIEGFWSQLKRTIKGTHIQVSPKHLHRYAGECSFRYSNRKDSQGMFHTILGQIWVLPPSVKP